MLTLTAVERRARGKPRLWHRFLMELEMRRCTDLKHLTAERCGVEKSEL